MFRFRDGETIDILANALDDLRKTLQGVRAISFTGDSADIIEYAAKLLGPGSYYRLFYGLFFRYSTKIQLSLNVFLNIQFRIDLH